MKLFHWLKERWMPKGIANWAVKTYREIEPTYHADDRIRYEEALAKKLLQRRYSANFADSGEELTLDAELVADNMLRVVSIHDACHLIAYFEHCKDIHELMERATVYRDYCVRLNVELERCGFRPPSPEYQFELEDSVFMGKHGHIVHRS